MCACMSDTGFAHAIFYNKNDLRVKILFFISSRVAYHVPPLIRSME